MISDILTLGYYYITLCLYYYHYYAALLPRRGPHIASYSVRLSVRPVIVAIGYVFSAPLASRRAT